MGIKIKNLQTGEFEKFNIPALKGEKGEPGEIEPSEKVDYIGKQHSKLRDTMNANVDYIIKTAIGEFNYLDYEGQHITATNSIEGHARSAILKGQTLVNLFKYSSSTDGFGGYFDKTTSATKYMTFNNRIVKYHLPANTNMPGGASTPFRISANDERFVVGKEYSLVFRVLTLENAKNVVVLGTSYIDSTDYIKVDFIFDGTDVSMIKFGRLPVDSTLDMTIEVEMLYLGEKLPEDMDLNIPYFEGMQSVKMHTLHTVGKNLFDKEAFYNDWKSKIDTYVYKEIVDNEEVLKVNNFYHLFNDKDGFRIDVKKGVPLTFRMECKKAGTESTNAVFTIRYGDNIYKSFPICHSDEWTTYTTTFVPTRDYITFCSGYNNDGYYYVKNIQLEEGNVATSYEPYKSNILTVNEPVELRGIGDVQDTLDCLTGEVTERVGEIMLDGSENWSKYNVHAQEGYTAFITTIETLNNLYHDKNINFISADFPTGTWHDYRSNLIPEFVWNHDPNKIGIRVRNEIATDVNGIKAFLSANNIKINYKLATPVVKTVDLSDNVVYSYSSITHYSCSSEDGSLVPTLSVKVPTDTQLTIQEQKATTQTLLIKNMDLQQSIKEVQAMNLAFNTALYNSFNSIREEVEDIKKHVSTNENLEGSF